MKKTLISIDCGMSTGIAVGTYSDTEPYKLTHAFQIEGGVEGFIQKVSHYHDTDDFSNGGTCFSVDHHSGDWGKSYVHWYGEMLNHLKEVEPPTFLVEKFTARGGANQFQYRTSALEPLRVEGAILAMGIEPEWVSPQYMYFAGGKGSEAKKNAHRWLRDNGLYISPKSVGCKDADDARSATLHAVSWLRRQKHMPTINHYFPEGINE